MYPNVVIDFSTFLNMKTWLLGAIAVIAAADVVLAHGSHSHTHNSRHNSLKQAIAFDSPITYKNGALNIGAIESRLQDCDIVQELEYLDDVMHAQSSNIHKFFDSMFPFGPALNSILAVVYVCGIPSIILTLIPPINSPTTLSLLVSFAVGGLLGDVFLHILPEMFTSSRIAGLVVVDEKRNAILGVALFVGLMTFVFIDKLMRIVNGSSDHGHSHSHSHSHSHTHTPPPDNSHNEDTSKASSTSVPSKEIRSRKRAGSSSSQVEPTVQVEQQVVRDSARTSAYLNVIADFSHNLTDGIAISASFFSGKHVGAITCLAMFCHEVPHQIGDFALLLQGGFSKPSALKMQLITTSGALAGVLIGIATNLFYTSTSSSSANATNEMSAELGYAPGIGGTNVMLGDLVLPFTAGGFLYIATIGVLPEILAANGESSQPLSAKLFLVLKQAMAMGLGIAIMFGISWTE